MKSVQDFLNVLYRSILAGIMIAIGGTVYLASDNKVVGALLFTIGLFVICSAGFNLYTGKIGYLVTNKLSYLKELGVIIFGNLIGTYSVGFLIQNTRLTGLVEKAAAVCETKLSDDLLSIFILACFCGALMFLGVDGFRSIPDPVGKHVSIFLAVMVFILSGFEHCIANMFYFTLAGVWSWNSILYMAVMIAGNAVGALFFSYFKLLIAKHTAVSEAKAQWNKQIHM